MKVKICSYTLEDGEHKQLHLMHGLEVDCENQEALELAQQKLVQQGHHITGCVIHKDRKEQQRG